MIIDFHTHAYPPAIVERTLKYLYESSGGVMYARTKGMIGDLLDSMREAGIDRSVILPVATKPSQFGSINRYSVELNQNPGITAFGGIHPASEHIPEEMRQIRELGLKGIKLHPDYQGADFDDPGYFKIFAAAVENDLIVVTHAGRDPYSDDHTHCTPDMILRVHRAFPDLKLVCAHNGSRMMWDEVETKLCGRGIYFDTSRMCDISKEQFLRLVDRNGADHMLFATDNPWVDIKEELRLFHACGLDSRTEQMILSENAMRLLGE